MSFRRQNFCVKRDEEGPPHAELRGADADARAVAQLVAGVEHVQHVEADCVPAAPLIGIFWASDRLSVA